LGVIEAMRKFASAHMFVRQQPIDAFFTTQLIHALSQIEAYELLTGSQPKELGHWLTTHSFVHANGKSGNHKLRKEP
jgi:hypothetical protein